MWTEEETSRRLWQIRQLPYGLARTTATEWVVRTLSNDGPEQKLPEALLDLVEAYTFGPASHHGFAAFSRLLRLWDEHPEYFDEQDQQNLFWEFKWVITDLTSYPQISKTQARAMLDDMRARFAIAGHSSVAVDKAEFQWANHIGDAAAAKRWRSAWLAHGEDPMDCAACRYGSSLAYLVNQERFTEAIEVGVPTSSHCNREPATSLRYRALAFLELGDGAQAALHLLNAQATRDPSLFDASDVGIEFEILARGGALERGLRLLRDRSQPAFTQQVDPGTRFDWLISLIKGLAANTDQGQTPTFIREGETVAELLAWAVDQATPLAQAFDRRAQNTRFTEILERAQTAKQAAELDFSTERLEQAAAQATTSDDSAGNEPPAVQTQDVADEESEKAPETPEASYARADQLAARKDFARAAQEYRRAAQLREEAGELGAAGTALADAAQCYSIMQEYSQSFELFYAAWKLLAVGGIHASALLDILAAWCGCAEKIGTVHQLADAATAVEQHLQEPDTTEMLGEYAERRVKEYAWNKARLVDMQARIGAASAVEAEHAQRKSANGEGDTDSSHHTSRIFEISGDEQRRRAVELAHEAAQAFTDAGDLNSAGSSYALIGKLEAEAQQHDAAQRAYESALEAFTTTRNSKLFEKTIDEYVTYLRSIGLEAKATELMTRLFS
ncbi:tetratricopeptide (TPR) repeat protein [Arcanobacterium pluranimalium]|uniref:hypothetical protein n=1 Tax=Arcanobacterium pluranimalium TaxID=108028 RepID=UPI00195B7679|nr:hypothetical protein [Arcanobacterium pluranimalium]MBM7824740.1 tetratricopeptide (TPR) repeat protein [Arcanobacterium pluranimalium]